MDMRIYGNYMIGKILDKFYIFYMRASLGGVHFSQASEAFHTVEDAHLWLLEQAKEDSTSETELLIIEVQKQYMLIGHNLVPDPDMKEFKECVSEALKSF